MENISGELEEVSVDDVLFIAEDETVVARQSEWECMCDCRSGVHHEESESDTDTSTENDTSCLTPEMITEAFSRLS